MRNYLILILSICLLNRGIAQNSSIDDVVTGTKWEVGTDLLWLIDKNTLPKYSLLFRRKVGQHGAIRLRGGYLKNANYLAFRRYDFNTASLLRLGYEYQKVLSRQNGGEKLLLYGGVDYFWRYENNHYYIWDLVNPPPYVGTGVITTDITREQGGALFIGFKYFIRKNISLSAESSFQVSHVAYSQDERGFVSGYRTYNEFPRDSYQLLPINVLNLSVHF